MNKFEEKIVKMKSKLVDLEYFYGHNNSRAWDLRKKVTVYEKVAKMSSKEVSDQITYTAGEVMKKKIGMYPYSSVDEERKLLKVLTERIKAEKQEQRKNSSNSGGSGVEIGHSVDDMHGGIEIG